MVFEKSRTGYVVVFEKARYNWSAYAPDLPGCVAAGLTLELTQRLMDEAIVFHQRGMRRDGEQVPRPRSLAELRRRRLF